MSKISTEVIKYIVDRKRRDPDISCRKLSLESSERFHIKISKSSINYILKARDFKGIKGRKVSRIFVDNERASGIGYCFILGANYLINLSKILALVLRRAHPMSGMSIESLETLSLAWIMARAYYNVPLDKMADYSKNEIWKLIGKKVSKGLLKRYLETYKVMQTVNSNIVTELNHVLQDVLFIRFRLRDGTDYNVDAGCHSLWSDEKIPIEFSTTIENADSCVNNMIFKNEPFVVFGTRPESLISEILSDLVFSFEGASEDKRIEKVEFISPKHTVVKEVAYIMPNRMKFVIGIWPWQYKAIAELESVKAQGSYFFEAFQEKYAFAEKSIKFTQHTKNKEVMLRLIGIKRSDQGLVRIGLLTNATEEEMTAQDVVSCYVQRFPFFEESHKAFLNAVKNPGYVEEFISSEKILTRAKQVLECPGPEEVFIILVELLHMLAKRAFFPSACADWSLLKMREIFYKREGRIRRDMSSDILFNLLELNKLDDIESWKHACLKFNEARLIEPSQKRLWLACPR